MPTSKTMPEITQRSPTLAARSLHLAACAVACCLIAMVPPHLHAQGCAQCRDNTASTSSATQRAFRHSIEFMTIAATAFFAATFLAIRRTR